MISLNADNLIVTNFTLPHIYSHNNDDHFQFNVDCYSLKREQTNIIMHYFNEFNQRHRILNRNTPSASTENCVTLQTLADKRDKM